MNNTRAVNKYITYFALFVIINWGALHSYVLVSSGSGYIILFITLFAVLNELKYSSFISNILKKPYVYLFLWIVYSLVNTFYINTYQANTSALSFVFSVVLPFFVILIISNKRYDFLELINLFILAFFLRIILSLVFDSFTDNTTDDVLRLGDNYNANEIAFGAYFLVVLIGLKNLVTNRLTKISYLQIGLALLTIGLTSSRKTFLAVGIILIGYIYLNRSSNIVKRYFKYFISLSFILFVSVTFIANTNVGKRISGGYTRTIEAESTETMFDSRMGQYVLAIDVVKEDPITGIGLYNFAYLLRDGRTAHSEYIVQFVECGIIGVILIFLFYRSLFLGLLTKRHNNIKDRRISEFFIFFLLSALFIMLGSWMYNRDIYWVIIGLLIKYIEYKPALMGKLIK